MTLFEDLRASHDKQRRLLDLLVKTHGDSEGRDELFQRLRAELENHAAAEERALYIPMMEYDMTQEKARHSVAEHHEIDELLETLEATEYDSPGWLASAISTKRNRKCSSWRDGRWTTRRRPIWPRPIATRWRAGKRAE